MPTAALIQTALPTRTGLGKLPETTSQAAPITIHRRTNSHHGAALATLGHAAEYLAETRGTDVEITDTRSEREAIHLLMRLSREIFDDYASVTRHRHPVADWIMSRAVRVYGAA